jgi:hypothetical protein
VAASFVGQDPTRDTTMLRLAQQAAQVAEPHQRLQQLVGDWEVAVVTTPPGAAPRDERGRVVGKAILGGRYVVCNHSLRLSGSVVEAVQILGFDTLRGQFTASWRDDQSTWAVEASGPPGDEAGLLVLRGQLADVRDPAGRPFRLELDLRAPGRVVVRLFDHHDGRELLLQQQTWTKA